MAKVKQSKEYRNWIQSVRVVMIERYLRENSVRLDELVYKAYSSLTSHEVSLLLTCADALRFEFPYFESRAFAMHCMLRDYYENLPF